MSITEGTQPAVISWTGAWTSAQTTASFTPESGALLVALVCGSGIGGGAGATASITDSLGGTWTLLLRTNTVGVNTFGTAEVWCRDSPGSSMTVSATGDARSAPGGQLTVRTLIGALATAQQNGATGTKSNDSPATVQQSVAAGTGNKVYGSAFNWDNSTAMTVLGNTTAIAAVVDATNGDNWASFKSTGDTAGTATYGYSTSVRAQFSAVEIKAAPSGAASLPFNPGKTWLRQFKHRQVLPTPPPSPVVVATATPQPIVVTGPTSPPLAAVVTVNRGTLQDDPVLTTKPPLVLTPQPPPLPVGVATVKRGSLQDDPVLTTRPPLVVIGGTPLPAGVSTQARSSLIDLVTPAPLVINPQPARPVPGSIIYSRGTLQDDPVLTTKPPVVTVGAVPLPVGVLAFTARSSLVDTAPPAPSTPGPIVVAAPRPQIPAGSIAVLRNTLQDDAVLTTQPPIVVAVPKPQIPAGSASVYRGTLADPTPQSTPQPIIVTGPTPVPLNTPQPYMSRSSYADVVVAVGTPSPIVVASQVKQAAASPIILRRNSLQDDAVLTTRPPLVVAAPYLRIPTATIRVALPASGIGVPFSTVLTGNVHGPDGQLPAGMAGTAAGSISGNVQVAIGPLGGGASGTTSGSIPGDMHGPSSPGEAGTIS